MLINTRTRSTVLEKYFAMRDFLRKPFVIVIFYELPIFYPHRLIQPKWATGSEFRNDAIIVNVEAMNTKQAKLQKRQFSTTGTDSASWQPGWPPYTIWAISGSQTHTDVLFGLIWRYPVRVRS